VACDTRRGLRRGGRGTLLPVPPYRCTVRNPWWCGTACEWPAVVGESPVHEPLWAVVGVPE
jgi:hypothetical protein